MSKRRSRKSKSVPPGEIDHLAEALRLIKTFPPLESLDELQDKYIRVMRTGIATTPQEERMLAEIEEFRRKGIMIEFASDIADPMTASDDLEEAVGRRIVNGKRNTLFFRFTFWVGYAARLIFNRSRSFLWRLKKYFKRRH